MNLRRLTSAVTAVALAGTALMTTAPAQAWDSPQGTRSLAEVLAADGSGFDKNARDFDILENAVLAVLAENKDSAVAVLTDGSVRLTAFAPTDGAFRRLVYDLTGKRYASEEKVFTTLAGAAGIDVIEDVLLYHVVPGATITYKQARKSDGAELDTALEGASVKVKVHHGRVFIVDGDPDDRNARVLWKLRDINKGNKQIAHGISEVLRPMNLP